MNTQASVVIHFKQRERVKGVDQCGFGFLGVQKEHHHHTVTLSSLPSAAVTCKSSGIKESPPDGRCSASPRILPHTLTRQRERSDLSHCLRQSPLFLGGLILKATYDSGGRRAGSRSGIVHPVLPLACKQNWAHSPSSQPTFLLSAEAPLELLFQSYFLNDILKLHFQVFKNVKSKNLSKQSNSGDTCFYVFRVLLSDLIFFLF